MKVKRVRGDAWGAWISVDRCVRYAYRDRLDSDDRDNSLGFRCCFPISSMKINKRKVRDET